MYKMTRKKCAFMVTLIYKKKQKTEAGGPVSYTHLDVYKRQGE